MTEFELTQINEEKNYDIQKGFNLLWLITLYYLHKVGVRIVKILHWFTSVNRPPPPPTHTQ